jgi:hypothetical protein
MRHRKRVTDLLHSQNTGSEFRSDSCLLQGWCKNCSGKRLRCNAIVSSAHILWILYTGWATKSPKSVPQSTRRCTKVILPVEGYLSRTDNFEVCESHYWWIVGKGIPSSAQRNDSNDLYCNGACCVWGRKGIINKKQTMPGASEWSLTSNNHLDGCWSSDGTERLRRKIYLVTAANRNLFDTWFQHHWQQLLQEVGTKETGTWSTFTQELALI